MIARCKTEEGRCKTSKRLTADRLGAFSDGVIAVIITVMVPELKALEGMAFADLIPLWPTAVSYVASHHGTARVAAMVAFPFELPPVYSLHIFS